MRWGLALLPLAALLTEAAPGQDVASRIERFWLFNACRPMELVVEELGDEEYEIGLTLGNLKAATARRLRAARLYTEDPEKADFAYLDVYVNVFGPAYTILVEYKKKVADAFGQAGKAVTWNTGSTGTHGKDAGFIVSSLSQHLDRFLAAYLRVNEEACGALAGQP